MLLDAGQPGPALREFEATLQKEPDRYGRGELVEARRFMVSQATARSTRPRP